MNYRLPINTFFHSLLCLGLLSLSGIAGAQVYKSYDAEGNVVFSDKPTQGSIEIELSKPNLSDSFEIPTPRRAAPEVGFKPETEFKPEPTAQPIAQDESADANESADTNNDGRISRREKKAQREAEREKRREEAKSADRDSE